MPRGVKKTVAAKGVKRWASNKAPAPNLDIKGESVLPKGKKYARAYLEDRDAIVSELAFALTRAGLLPPTRLAVGDNVMVKSESPDEPSYVGQVDQIKKGDNGTKQLKLRWYYRPEDSSSGRQSWHGERELFRSQVVDWNYIGCVECKCNVHDLEAYENLDTVTAVDFYSRFEYNATTGHFRPDVVPVYCYCEHPYNPDRDMVMCKHCKDWFHCDCVDFYPSMEGDFYCRSHACQEKKNELESSGEEDE